MYRRTYSSWHKREMLHKRIMTGIIATATIGAFLWMGYGETKRLNDVIAAKRCQATNGTYHVANDQCVPPRQGW